MYNGTVYSNCLARRGDFVVVVAYDIGFECKLWTDVVQSIHSRDSMHGPRLAYLVKCTSHRGWCNTKRATQHHSTNTQTHTHVEVMTSIAFEVVSVEVCHDWPLGKCQHGNECTRKHHENLDPSLPYKQLEPVRYMVPDQVNTACRRCMQRMYPASLPC
jgi:hypothetical protein